MATTTENKNPIPTATYQGNLHHITGLIINSRAFGNIEDTWNNLLTLYDILPPECEKEVNQLYNQICHNIQTIHAKHDKIAQRDDTYANLKLNKAREKYLRTANRDFHRLMMNSLFKHNWLTKDLTIKPRIEETPEI